MKNTVIKSIAAVLLLSLFGCYYDNPPENALPSNVSFAKDIQPVLNQNCISCHNGNLAPDLREGNSYDALMALPQGSIVPGNANASELYQMLNGGGDNPMPPGSSLSQSKIDLFYVWINEGALNN